MTPETAAEQEAPEGAPPARRSARTLLLCGFLVFAATVFCALGVWQVERRAWKHDLIARVESRINALPVAALGPASGPSVAADTLEYLRVHATGRFLNDDETLVQAVTERGPGFWVIVPLRTDEGFVVLVNRGFVPQEAKDRQLRREGEVEGTTTVVGLLRLSEPGGGFLRANDPAGGRWYSRDVAAIAADHGLDNVVPYFIDADATANEGGLPVGGLTVVRFADSHLVYAITWFVLAAMAVAGVIRVWTLRA